VLLAASSPLVFLAARRIDLLLGDWAVQMTVTAIGFGIVGWLALPIQPGNRAVWVTTLAAFLIGLGGSAWDISVLWLGTVPKVPVETPLLPALVLGLGTTAGWSGVFLILTVGLLLFPDGNFHSPLWRWIGRLSLGSVVTIAVALAWTLRPSSSIPYEFEPDEVSGVAFLIEPLVLLVIALCGLSVVSVFAGHRRSQGIERQQYRWIGLGATALFASFAGVVIADRTVGIDPAWERMVVGVGLGALITCYGIAITRHRLYDIDIVISRTLVFAALAGFIGLVYVLVVVGVSRALDRDGDNLVLSIVATAIVAIAFEPVRRGAQAWANRVVFGRRATPYQVLSDLAQRLAGAEPADAILDRMARLMAEGTGSELANVWLVEDEHLRLVAGWPNSLSSSVQSVSDLSGAVFPVMHENRLVGALQVEKSRGNPLTPPETRLLTSLAASAGLVMGNQILTAALRARAQELKASRRRLVEVQDLERRALERDLHDGAQQNVVALKVKVSLAGQVAAREGAGDLATLMSDIANDAQAAVEEIRSLARGIYPPLLESRGLEAAVRSLAASLPIPVEVRCDLDVPLEDDTESAVYFALAEALSNVAKHAEAESVQIDLKTVDETFSIRVADDGRGFDTSRGYDGMGLINIRDRIEALGGTVSLKSSAGGGTKIDAHIPLQQS